MTRSRRRVLLGAGGFITVGLAGCSVSDSSETPDTTPTNPDRSCDSVGDVSVYYPTENMGIVTLYGYTSNSGRPDDPRPLSELAPAEHRDAILAITRQTYYPTEATADEDGLEGPMWVRHANTAFGIEVAAGSRREDVMFDRVLTLEPSRSASELTLTVRNDGQEPYQVGHVGRPYFGVLIAWDGEHHYLRSEHYAQNDHLVTGDGYAYPAWTDEDTDEPDNEWLELPPGDSTAETYGIPEGVGDCASVYIDVPYRRNQTQTDADRQEQRVVWYVTIGT